MPEIATDGATIWYDQSGEGPDLVWVAGGDQPGSDWRLYQVPYFDGQWRNTTYDPRGVGRTRCEPEPELSIAAHAADCAALIREACEAPVITIGLSMGSLIVQEICLTYPELVRCGVAMGTSAEAQGYLGEWMRAEVEFRRNGGTLPEDFAITHYGAFMFPSEVLGDPELWARVRPMVAGAYGKRSGGDLAAQWEGCITFDSSERLPGCEVPLHVIAFSQDMQCPSRLGRRVAELAPRGEFHLLDGLGHCSAFGHRPEMVNECIAGIVEQFRD